MVIMNNKTVAKKVPLNRIGNVDSTASLDCSNFTIDFMNGEYVTKMEINYNLATNISYIAATTNTGRDILKGKQANRTLTN